jgi:hypothetical protein
MFPMIVMALTSCMSCHGSPGNVLLVLAVLSYIYFLFIRSVFFSFFYFKKYIELRISDKVITEVPGQKFFHYCVYSTRRPRFRTLCGTARLKSLYRGGEREREEVSECKNVRNNA